jgi:hypothetical protein
MTRTVGIWLGSLCLVVGGCTSSEGGGPIDHTHDAGPAASDDWDAAVVEGRGEKCPVQDHQILATKVVLDVNWPGSPGVVACDGTTECSDQVTLWLLSKFDVTGDKWHGTTTTCANQTPTIELTELGAQAEGVSAGSAALSIQFPPKVWDDVAANPDKEPVPATGHLGGWRVGSTFTTDPTVAFFGLKPTSSLSDAAATWPASESSLAASDLADDDHDGHPGITAKPSTTGGNVLPATGLLPGSAQADEVYVVLRTSLALRGTGTSCTEISGMARATLFNSHVIGCHLEGGGECDQTQWDFVDQVSPVYIGEGVTIPSSVKAPSFAPAGITGTFSSKVLTGEDVDCADVRAAFP